MPILEEKREILQDINEMTVFDYLIFKIAGQKGKQTDEAFCMSGIPMKKLTLGSAKLQIN